MSSSAAILSTRTPVDEPQNQLSLMRKLTLLLMFCVANFLDVFSTSALIPAIPVLENSMGITQSQSAWIISAFQLTFASFLLISGRMSDIYSPKMVFVSGVSLLGTISIGAGFVNSKIAIIALRALMGITSAMSIPSALTILVWIFPEPAEQALAIGAFSSCGAIGTILGLFIGAVLVQYVSYHWIFWFISVAAIPSALISLLLIPSGITKSRDILDAHSTKWKRLDLVGVSVLTVALILFIYAMTTGSEDGWATAGVLTPVIISMLLIAVFFYWETLVPFENAALPPRVWFYNNFSVLFGSAMYPLLWWDAVFLAYTTLWQDTFHWTTITTAVHMFPIAVAAIVTSFSGALSRIFGPKWIILACFLVVAVANVLLALGGGRPEGYWPYTFPAFVLGGGGTMMAYAHTNIVIFQVVPASMAGTVGAIFSMALQFGSAIGIAAFNSIQTSVGAADASGRSQDYRGHAAAFWFLFGIAMVEVISVWYFFRARGPQTHPDKQSNRAADASEKITETNGVQDMLNSSAQ